MSRASSALHLLRRRARAELSSLVALALLVAVTAGLAAVVPRVLSETSDEALASTLTAAPPEALEVTASTTNDESVAQLADVDRQLSEALTPELRDVVSEEGRGATTGLYDVLDRDLEPVRGKPFSWLQVRHQPGALQQVRYVAGTAPAATGGPDEAATVRTAAGEQVPLLEVALDARLARRLDLGVGRTVVLEPLEVAPLGDGTTAVRISGLFRPRDPAATAWTFAPLLSTLGQQYSADGQLVAEYAAALVDADQLAALADASPILRYDWHYPVEPSALDADNAATVLADVESVIAGGAFVGGSQRSVLGSSDSVTLSSGLVELLRAHLLRADATSSLVAVVLAGVLTVALAVLALACAVVVRRRAGGLALAHARGVSAGALTLAGTAEVATVVVPAGAAGALVARLAGGDRAWLSSALLAALVAVVALALVASVTRRSLGPSGAGGWAGRVPWRAVTEVSVVLGAVLAVAEVRRRGALTASTPERLAPGGPDPLLVLAPVLVVGAVVVLVLRSLPVVLRRASALAARRSGLLPFLPLARAARQPLTVALPLATLLLGLGFAVFASGVTTTVAEGQERAAWRDVGADYLLEAEYFEEQDVAAVADVAGVDQVVPALRREGATFFDPAGLATDGNVLVVDAAAYADLLATDDGSGIDPAAVAALAQPVGEDAPLPALATPPAAEALAAPQGEIDPTASLGRTAVAVTGEPATFPLDGDRGLVVLDLPSVQERESFPVRPNTLLVRGSEASAPALAEAAERLEQRVEVSDRRAVLTELTDSPFVGSTQLLFLTGSAAATAYCLLALGLALVLAARSRARLAATLRVLGAGPRRLGRLAVLEIAPLLTVMLVAGAAAGMLLVVLLLPSLDLQPLTGGSSAPETRVDVARVAGIVTGLTALVSLTVLGVSAVERRRGLGKTLRGGDET